MLTPVLTALLGMLWAVLAQPTWAQDFRPMFEAHSSIMLLIDPADGRIVDANPAAATFYGHDRATLRAMSIQDINTLSEEQVREERQLAAQRGRNFFIFRHRLHNGEERTVEVYSSPMQTMGRHLLLSVVHDITPERDLDAGLWYYKAQLEEMVLLRTNELQRRSEWLLACLLLVSLLALAWVLTLRHKKQLAVALSFRQGLLGALSDRSGMLSGLVDSEGRLCEVNQPALNMIDSPLDAVLGQPFVDTPWWTEQEKPRLRQALARAFQGQADCFETRHRNPAGRRIDVQFHAAPVLLDGKTFVSVIGIDISELKQQAQREKRNNRLLSAVFEHAEVGLALVSATGQWLTVNQRFAQTLGLACADMLKPGFDVQALLLPEEEGLRSASTPDFLNHEALRSPQDPRECCLLHANGQRCWAEFSVRTVQDDNQQPEYFVLVLMDVTERKQAGMRLQQATARSENSEALLRRTMDAMPHIVCVKNAQGRFQWVNAALARLYGSTPEAMQGKDDGDFNANAEQVAFYRRNIQDIIASGEQQVVQEESTDARTGEVRHYQSVKVPFVGPNGSPQVLVVASDITELIQTQQRLRQSEERMAFNLAATGDGLWDWWVQEDRVEHNAQWGHLLGLQDVPPSHPVAFFANVIHPDDRADVLARIEQALCSGERYVSEHRAVRADGQVVWLLDQGRVVARDAKGRALRMVGSARDISASKAVEVALRTAKEDALASLARLHEAEEIASLGHWVFDLASQTMEWSEQAHRMASIPEGRSVPLSDFMALVHPEDRAAVAQAWTQAVKTQGLFEIEHRMLVHGELRWMRQTAHLDRAKAGQVIGTVLDISKQRLLEEQRKRAEAALLETKTRLQQSEHLLIDTEQLALVGGWVLEVDSRRVYWTPGLYRLHELEPREGLDYLQASTACYLEADRPRIQAAFEACMTELKPYDLVLPFTPPSGRKRWIRTKTKPVVQDGRAVSVMGIVMDVTEQVQAEASLQAALEQAQQLAVKAEAANVAKSRFLATMSHELRTPLNGVLGMAQLLLVSPLDETRFRNHARTILHSGEVLLNLLNDILDLSKVEAGRITLTQGMVAPGEMVASVCTLFAFNAQNKGLVLHGHWAGEPEQRYQGDAYRLQQMLSNLVSNAIKFTHKGTVAVQVCEKVVSAGTAELEFSVSDTGIGIPAEQLPMLFQPFKQMDDGTSRHFGGTGLGLSIVKSLSRQMGGDVGVESVYGQGSRFWFRVRLPVMAHASGKPADPAASPAPLARLLEPPLSEAAGNWVQQGSMPPLQGHVLVVEDDATNREVVAAMLASLGAQVSLTEDGEQALQRLTKPEAAWPAVDLVLMDIHMPTLDGYATTERLRAWETQQGRSPMPVVALTASAFGDDRNRCLAVGMNGFLTKPLSMAALHATLLPWLGTQQPEPTLSAAPPPPVDWPAWWAALGDVLPLLAAAKFAAVDRFSALRQQVRGSAVDPLLRTIEADVQAFRFAQAHTALQALLERYSNQNPEA